MSFESSKSKLKIKDQIDSEEVSKVIGELLRYACQCLIIMAFDLRMSADCCVELVSLLVQRTAGAFLVLSFIFIFYNFNVCSFLCIVIVCIVCYEASQILCRMKIWFDRFWVVAVNDKIAASIARCQLLILLF